MANGFDNPSEQPGPPFISIGKHRKPRAFLLLCLVAGSILIGNLSCSRHTYRKWADRDAYSLIQSRQTDPLWSLPDRLVEPEPISRLADNFDPDCEPAPPDDPAANRLLRHPHRFHNHEYWDQIGGISNIENPDWEINLPVNEAGIVELDRARSIELALLHSRDYQAEVEQLYLSALGLSSNRFEFDTNWFGRTSASYSGSGRNSFANRFLSHQANLGFTRNLAAGGQIAASLANSLVWQLTPSGATTTSSSIVLSLAQPLLRGAYRHIRLESLSQAERNLLYQIRDFASFRRRFYLGVTRTYLGLLAQSQSLRNQRANLESLELNYLEFQELFERKLVSQISVDQVFQNYQSGRISFLASEQAYANSLDAFKFQLGLPSRVDIRINEDYLKPFELSDPRFDDLRERTDRVYQALVQYLPPETPPRELLDKSFEDYSELLTRLKTLIPSIERELELWSTKLANTDVSRLNPDDKLDFGQQQNLIHQLRGQLVDVKTDIESDINELEDQKTALASSDEAEGWKRLSRLIGRRFREQQYSLFIIQTQIRLFLIEVTPFDLDGETAIEMALANRLDLMNQRGRTMDSWRSVEIAADAFRSGLNVSTDVTLGTDPGFRNPVRFDSSSSSVQLGVQFDGPLNRFNERNNYRSAQIGYQQSRRAYMASEDALVNSIRSNLRRLKISWLNFQISRQQLIAATRQVDLAQLQLREISGDSSATRDLLQALQGLLDSKNGLISSWISYEVGRIELFVELELLYLDPDGTWRNEDFNPGFDDSSPREEALPGTSPAVQSNDPESSGYRFDDD